MSLQPEGQVNAEARLLAGDVQLERGQFDEAGRAFMGVALLYDDPTITPRALQKAAEAYQKAGKTRKPIARTRTAAAKYPEFRPSALSSASTTAKPAAARLDARLGDRQRLDRQRREEILRVIDLQDRLRQMRGEEARIRRRRDPRLRSDARLRQLLDHALDFAQHVSSHR